MRAPQPLPLPLHQQHASSSASRTEDGGPKHAQLRSHTATLLRVFFLCIDVTTVATFVLTSSMLYWLWPSTSIFADDLHFGVYDFRPQSPADDVLLAAMHSESSWWGRDTASLGYQDERHNALGTASHCKRLGVDIGSNNVVTYGTSAHPSQRVIKKFHGALPPTCTGFTVAAGEPFNSTRVVAHANDARLAVGQSFLRCTAPALWTSQLYDPVTDIQRNSSSFRFKAAYVIVQQHYAGAHVGVECQLSYCVARKLAVPDIDIWAVEPADPLDTRAYVHVLFTPKSWLLALLDVGGQVCVAAVLLRELVRAWRGDATVRIPMTRHSRLTECMCAVAQQLGVAQRLAPAPFDAGRSRLRLSARWLAHPLYMLGSCAHAVGTTVESQMLVEIYYWQYTKTGDISELVYAGVYSMRHAWVGIATCAVFRYVLDVTLRRLEPPRPTKRQRDHVCDVNYSKRSTAARTKAVPAPPMPQSLPLPYRCRWQELLLATARHLRSVHAYISCKSFLLAFFVASIGTVRGRGTLLLRQHAETPDVALGVRKSSFWGSEVAASLLLTHSVAHALSYALALALRSLCRIAWPHHAANSLLRTIDAHAWWPSFDVVAFLASNPHFVDAQQRFHVVVRLSECYELCVMPKVFHAIDFQVGRGSDSSSSTQVRAVLRRDGDATDSGSDLDTDTGTITDNVGPAVRNITGSESKRCSLKSERLVMPPRGCVLEIVRTSDLSVVRFDRVDVVEAASARLTWTTQCRRANCATTSSCLRSDRVSAETTETENDCRRRTDHNVEGIVIVR